MKRLLTLVLSVLLFAGCGGLSTDDVKREFAETRPEAEIFSVNVTDRSADRASFVIRYRMREDTDVRRADWLYERTEAGWRCARQVETPPIKTGVDLDPFFPPGPEGKGGGNE